MRNLSVHIFSNGYKKYKTQGQNELALQAAKAQIHYAKLLNGEIDLEAQGVISELLVEEEMYDEAIIQAKIGFDN